MLECQNAKMRKCQNKKTISKCQNAYAFAFPRTFFGIAHMSKMSKCQDAKNVSFSAAVRPLPWQSARRSDTSLFVMTKFPSL